MPEANSAMLYVPAGVDLPACLTHEAQRTDVSASLTEFSRNIERIRVSDKRGCDIFADLTDLVRSFKVYCFPADLVPVLANRCLCNSQAFRDQFLFHSVIFDELAGYHCSQRRNNGFRGNFAGNDQ